RRDFVATLIAGGGWTESPPGWGRARMNLVTRRQGDRDLAFVATDLFDAHLDRVAEPVRPPTAPPGECRAELVQLEVVARQPPCRQEPFEHLRESHEQARRDQTHDLALERGLPAELEQPPLEQP